MEYEEFINRNKGIVDTARKKTKKKKWLCFYPKCGKKAIKSHSQSASSSLKSIQINGLVIGRDLVSFPTSPQPGWRKIGINKASIFPGFCSKHDDKLFNQADSLSIENINKKALYFLSFRTFASEMRKKEYHADTFDRILQQLGAVDFLEGFNMGLKICQKVTKPYYMKKYEESIKSANLHPMVHCVYKVDRNIGISCSTLMNPVPMMEQPLDKPQPTISFNILPRKDYTLIALSSLTEDADLMSNFISNNSRLEDLVFNYCEEVLFDIELFESLDNSIICEIEDAQLPWEMWEHKRITDIFSVNLDENALYELLE